MRHSSRKSHKVRYISRFVGMSSSYAGTGVITVITNGRSFLRLKQSKRHDFEAGGGNIKVQYAAIQVGRKWARHHTWAVAGDGQDNRPGNLEVQRFDKDRRHCLITCGS